MMQLDMFAALTPVAPPPAWVPPPRCEVKTRAFSHDGMITLYGEDPVEPFELLVRGVPCVISYSGGFCTHAIEGPGSAFWSETGFRSFGLATVDPESVSAAIEAYIASKDCGGKLTRWWPSYVLQWQQSLAFELSFADRAGCWDQWGPEKHREHWDRHDAKLGEAIDRMRAEGIDPNDVGPPSGFRGKWPKVPA